MPLSFQLQSRWVRVCSVRTKDMELLSLSVLYIPGLRCRSKVIKNLMNFHLCRPAVTDPHKVRPCNYTWIVALPYMNTSWSIQIYTLNTFGEIAVTCSPHRMVNIDPHSLYFSCIYPQVWQSSVATVCMPMSSQLQGRWVRVCSVRTKDMELLSLTVLYIQGSDAGQK